ncbi:MAG: outer membrane beta-barrel protein [Gammaproteobacteria bacterium]
MRMLLPALALALIGTAAQAADNGVYLGVGVSQVKLDNVGKDFNTGNLNDFKVDDTSWKLIGGFRPIDNFAVELNYYDLGSENRSVGGFDFRADGKAYGGFAVGLIPIGPIDLFAKGGLVRWESKASADGPLGFRFDDDGTEFAWGLGVQARLGSLGGRLEYEHFDVDHTDGVEMLSLGVTWTFL